MSVVVVGLSHTTAPPDVLDRAHVSAEAATKLMAELVAHPDVDEVVVLATCQRTELYAAASQFHPATDAMRAVLAEHAGVDVAIVTEHGYALHAEHALHHLFSVACGLDAAVVGEAEVLGQVRSAAAAARATDALGPVLGAAFRRASEVGRRARADAAEAGSRASSLAVASVALAECKMGSLAGCRVGVVGVGVVGAGVVDALAPHVDPADVVVINRSRRAAAALARRAGAASAPLGELAERLADLDVVFCCTGSDDPVVRAADVAVAQTARRGRPLFLVDLGAPRDVETTVAQIDGVTVVDLHDIGRFAAENLAPAPAFVAVARAAVDRGVSAHLAATTGRGAAPVVTSLRAKAEAMRIAELRRNAARLGDLDERQRATVEAVTKALVAKVLHEPTVRLKDAAGTPRGDRLSASVRDLFDLDER